MKIFLDQEIDFRPKLVLWAGMPGGISDEIICSFFERDILLVDMPPQFDHLLDCKARVAALLVNLDELMHSSESEEINIEIFALNLAKTLTRYPKIIRLFHAINIPSQLKQQLHDKDILCYLTDELITPGKFEQVMESVLSPLYINKSCRTSLRLNFNNDTYPVELKAGSTPQKGFISDLSINGVGLVMNNAENLNNLRIGDFVHLTIDFKVTYLTILRGIVIRKDLQRSLVGLKINIDDPFMIDENNGAILKSIISTWINKLVQSHSLTYEKFS